MASENNEVSKGNTVGQYSIPTKSESTPSPGPSSSGIQFTAQPFGPISTPTMASTSQPSHIILPNINRPSPIEAHRFLQEPPAMGTFKTSIGSSQLCIAQSKQMCDSNNYFAMTNHESDQKQIRDPSGHATQNNSSNLPSLSSIGEILPSLQSHTVNPECSPGQNGYPTPNLTPSHGTFQDFRNRFLLEKRHQYEYLDHTHNEGALANDARIIEYDNETSVENIHDEDSSYEEKCQSIPYQYHYDPSSVGTESYHNAKLLPMATTYSDPGSKSYNERKMPENTKTFHSKSQGNNPKKRPLSSTDTDEDYIKEPSNNPQKAKSLSIRDRVAVKQSFNGLQRAARAKKAIADRSERDRKEGIRKWTQSDDDKVAFLREYGNLKWHEVTEFINGRHTPQAVQMRYLRSLKRRNDTLTDTEKAKLCKLVVEDYENKFKRISTQMGPSFTPVRIQKIFLQDAGLADLLKIERIWSKEEITKFLDAAAGDFDSFVVPYRADKLPPRAEEHMEKHMINTYEELIRLYVGSHEKGRGP